MDSAVLVILDGMRRDLITPSLTPNIRRLMGRGARFDGYHSVFPSATRVVSACTATGCRPRHHGLTGNSMALIEHGELVAHDAGLPDFLQHKRRVTGRSLERATLAERLARRGGAMIFSNVSPGAAYAHDPDGHGYVFHRAGSFAPGRQPLAGAAAIDDVTLDAGGDARMTARCIAEAIGPDGRRPALTVLWLGEPDASQHAHPLGSPDASAAITAADTRLGEVIDAVDRRRARGDSVLLLAGSDHGHQTVSEIIDVNAALASAGFTDTPEDPSGGVIAISNGTGCLVYLSPARAAARPDDAAAIVAVLRAQAWAGMVFDAATLPEIGHHATGGLIAAISLRCDAAANPFGVVGTGAAAKPLGGKPNRLGRGQHGGLGTWEQMAFMVADGAGFSADTRVAAAASPIDLAPTILRHLGASADGCDGRAL